MRWSRILGVALGAVLLAGCSAGAQPTPTPAAPAESLPASSDDLGASLGPRPGIETFEGSGSPSDGSPAPNGETAPPSTDDANASGSPGTPGTAGTGKALDREVFAFVNHYSLDKVEGKIEYDVLTHIAFFSLDVDANGHLVKGTAAKPSEGWAGWTGPRMTKIIDDAHASGTKVVLTASRFAWTPSGRRDTIALLSKPAARRRMAQELAAEVEARGVDGINIDLEPVPTGQRKRFTALVREVRAALDAVRPGLELTFASIGFTDEYDLKAVIAPDAADAVFVMAYQYRGNWSEISGSVAPIDYEPFSVNQTLSAFLGGTSPDRVIMGVPYYGWQWRTVSNRPHAATLPATARNGHSRPIFYEEAAGLAEQYGSTFDAREVSALVVYRKRDCAGCLLLWREAYFDDRQSLARKYRIVHERGLRGVGIWALGFEGNRSAELYQVLREGFGTSP